MAYVVTGGHSPIAIAISKSLSSKTTVFHVSSKIDLELQATFAEHSEIVLEKWDLEQTTECLEKFKQLLSHENVEGVISKYVDCIKGTFFLSYQLANRLIPSNNITHFKCCR